MPIRPENLARYPKDWKTAVVPRVRERSGNRCECTGHCGLDHGGRCEALNGEPHPKTGSKVVLTTAHLGQPSDLPLFLHVTRHAMADEIFQLVGLFVPLNAEMPEWRLMMHDRAALEFSRSPATSGAGFFVPIPNSPASRPPAWPVVFDTSSPRPIWVGLTRWSLFGKPLQSTGVPAEAAATSDMVSAYRIAFAAALAHGLAESALRDANGFVAAGYRASSLAIRSLLRGHGECFSADSAVLPSGAFSWAGHTSLYHNHEYPENCSDTNLLHMCQQCHNRYDAPMRRAGIKERARAQCAAGDLFSGQPA